MIWSISESRTFRRCQRQWYYKNILASPVAKDDGRRRAYLLSKLQSVSAWRGNIVDSVISDHLVSVLSGRRSLAVGEAQRIGLDLFDRQLAFARTHPLNRPGFSPSKVGSELALLHSMEYGGFISEDEIKRARTEVATAIENLYAMHNLFNLLRPTNKIIVQRALCFPHSDVTVRAVPDLVAFYTDRAPVIVDWKVHAFGIREAWLQLAVYGLALTRCKPHTDFPRDLSRWGVTDVELVEVQLLSKQLRRYSLSEEEVERAEAYIASSATDILCAVGDRESKDLCPEDFRTTSSADACARCAFRAICWEEAANGSAS